MIWAFDRGGGFTLITEKHASMSTDIGNAIIFSA
jgi:hypothetical protein